MTFALLVSLLVHGAAAADKDPGVKTGHALPAFQLTDQNGRLQNFKTLRGPKGLMLVFFRSADW